MDAVDSIPQVRDLSDDHLHRLLREAEDRLRRNTEAHEDPQQPSELELSHPAPRKFRIPKLDPGQLPQPYVRSVDGKAKIDSARAVDTYHWASSNGPRKVDDPVKVKQEVKAAKKASAGPKWFDMPKTEVTAELKRDLQLLRMRPVLDPKRHYKKMDASKPLIPEFSHVGTIVEGPTEFYSARIPKVERKKTFVEEVLSRDESVSRFRRKYNEVQAAKTSGKKAHYQKLKAQRAKRTIRR